MKSALFVVAPVLMLLSALPAFAVERVRSSDLTCSELQAKLAEEGTLYVSGHIYTTDPEQCPNLLVPSYANTTAYAVAGYEIASDKFFCRVGWTCAREITD